MATQSFAIIEPVDVAQIKQGKAFKWTGTKRLAAQLLANGRSHQAVADELDLNLSIIVKWANIPEFAARVDMHTARIEAQIMSTGIARRAARAEVLQRMHDMQMDIVAKREAENGNGLLAVEPRMVGDQIIPVEQYDAGMSREMRAVLNQMAEETGQKIDRTELSGPNGGPIPVSVTFLDEIHTRVAQAIAKRAQKTAIDV